MKGLMKGNNMTQKNNGFTLIELMVVVLIIGILVAIAVPVYRNTAEIAAKRACQANVRTINGAAIQFWLGNDRFPIDIDEMISPAYLQAKPHCPTDGREYSYNKDTGTAVCTNAAHN